MKHQLLILPLVLFLQLAGAQTKSGATYTNPVINADYSDPDVIRVGGDYFMVASSFNHIPGLPILHSTNLVNWTLIGHALQQQPPFDHYSKVQHGGGVWAPSIRYHNNEFYIYYPDPDFGIYLLKAKNITGPWSQPLLVEAGKGLIDPCPMWDEDGRAYMAHAFAGSRAGIKSILVVREMNREGTQFIGKPVMVYDGHDADPTIEGPKFYKRNGYYYIFAPAGGVSTGWQLALRSKHIYGPYERKVVMDQGGSPVNGPHQGAWVDTKTGEHWFLHFQDKGAYGRVVHLQPLQWKNHWPVIGEDLDGDGKGQPVMEYQIPNLPMPARIIISTSDEFDSPLPGLQWQWQANPQTGWAFPTSGGYLRMFSVYQPDSIRSIWNLPCILAQKLPADAFTATVKLSFKPRFNNERMGLVLFGSDYAWIALQKTNNGLQAVCRENEKAADGGQEKEIAAYPVNSHLIYLRVQMEAGGAYRLAFSQDGASFTTIPKSFTAKPGRWVGAKIGLFCLRDNMTNDAGFADIDWFRFEKPVFIKNN